MTNFSEQLKVSILLTGDELMTGDTVDSNSSYLSQSLKDFGVVPQTKRVVGDDLVLLEQSILELTSVSDVLVINGGLGPTVDDLTALALANAAQELLTRNADALEHLEAWAKPRDFVLTESNLKQADLPSSCEVIPNPVGSAVGFKTELNHCLVICTPGVPYEFKRMVDEQVVPLIRQKGSLSAAFEMTRLRLFGITESGLQDIVNNRFPDWPPQVNLGFRVQMPVIEVKLITQNDPALNKLWTQKFQALFADYIIGKDDTSLPQALNLALLDKELVLTTAESCTGGAIAAAVTSEPGSSKVFQGGFVSYSNDIKHSVLGVAEETLGYYGAVSEQVVLEMAAGALKQTKANIAVAISGIAGPDGGTREKPVGLVWMAWGREDGLKARQFFLPVGRRAFQRTATAIAMDLVRREVMGLDTSVDYFSELKRQGSKLKE